MKKNVIGLAILGSLTLTACGGGGGGDGPADPIVPPGPGSTARTKAIFETTDSDADGYTLPLPNDILFSGTTDLTINIPGVTDADLTGTDGTKRNQAALSKLDGWSATAPFVIKFNNVDGTSKLDTASFTGNVHVYKVKLQRDEAVPGTGIIKPTGPVTSIEGELVAGTDYKFELAPEDATGKTLRILPLKPLGFQSSYMVVLTNGIKDTGGNGVIADATYGVVKQTTPLPSTDPARGLQVLVNAQEAAAATKGIATADIVLSYVFTVQSRDVMTKGLPAVFANPSVKGVITSVAKPSFAPVVLPFSALKPETAAIGGSNVLVRFGEVSVPYFSKPGNGTAQDVGPVFGQWGSPATIPGTTNPNPFFPNLNYAIPVPALQGASAIPGFERLPLIAATPNPAICPKPATGYPVTIFQHGITGNRTQMLATAIALNNPPACQAVVSIDLPMHGISATDPLHLGVKAATGFDVFKGYAAGGVRERTFGLDLLDAAGTPLKADGVVDSSGSWFINLLSLGTSRDNLRQGASDLKALTMAIPVMDYDGDTTPDLDGNKISFVGISLGGIVGTVFTSLDGVTDNKIKAAVLNVPGGGIAKLLDGSSSFGPRIRGGLAANGIVAGTATYESFLWVAQTLVDSGDPVNFVDLSKGKGNPVLVQEVVGNGSTNPSDLVVPNSVAARTFTNPVTGLPYTVYSEGPLGGTEALIANLGVTSQSAPIAPSANNVRAAVRFLLGHHGSLLTTDMNGNGVADEPAVFGDVQKEMQGQMASFIITGGKALSINPALVGSVVKP